MVSYHAIFDGTSGAIISSSTGVSPPADAPRHVALVFISCEADNYTKWAIYMCASLGRAGPLSHVNDTVAPTPTEATWSSDDYTILNILHTAIDVEVADMILYRDQTKHQFWLAAPKLLSSNKANSCRVT
jgi:hypothetical protein